MISEDSVTSTAERRRERVVGSEKKASQEGGSRGKVRRTSDGDKSDKSDQSKEKSNFIDAAQWQNLTVQERDHLGQKTGLRRQWN